MKYFFQSGKGIPVLLSLFFLLAACTEKKVRQDDAVITLQVDWKHIGDKWDYSSIVEDSVRIISLEDRNDCLIGEITELILQNDLIYIADNLSKSVFVFDLNGKLISRVHAVGSGPGEYVTISGFTVFDDRMIVFDHMLRRLLIYDSSGRFIRSIDTSAVWGEDLFVLGKYIYLFNNDSYSDSGYYHLFVIDPTDNNKIGKYFPFTGWEDNCGWGILSYYTKLKDEALFTCFPYDTLYQVKNKQISPCYVVDFGEKRLPRSYIYGDSRQALTTAVRDNYVTGIEKISQSEAYIFIQFRDGENTYLTVYNKKDGTLRTHKKLINAKLGNLLLQLHSDVGYTIQDEKLIQCYPGDYWMLTDSRVYEQSVFYSDEVKRRFIELCRQAKADANPVIFIQHLKK